MVGMPYKDSNSPMVSGSRSRRFMERWRSVKLSRSPISSGRSSSLFSDTSNSVSSFRFPISWNQFHRTSHSSARASGDRSFSAASPQVWNDLPPGLRRPPTMHCIPTWHCHMPINSCWFIMLHMPSTNAMWSHTNQRPSISSNDLLLATEVTLLESIGAI